MAEAIEVKEGLAGERADRSAAFGKAKRELEKGPVDVALALGIALLQVALRRRRHELAVRRIHQNDVISLADKAQDVARQAARLRRQEPDIVRWQGALGNFAGRR